jgi:hypothetical protein
MRNSNTQLRTQNYIYIRKQLRTQITYILENNLELKYTNKNSKLRIYIYILYKTIKNSNTQLRTQNYIYKLENN